MAEFSSFNGYIVKDITARNIAKGRNQAVAYSDYASMVAALNAMDKEEFKTGQNIYIGTVGVPDLWVYSVEPTLHTFVYSSDEATVALLENNGTIQAGYYKLAMLEGQKVDLSTYDERITANSNAITANKNALSSEIAKLNEKNENLGGFTPVIDDTGKITGYKTSVGGADTVFPFKSIDDFSSYLELIECQWVSNGGSSSTKYATFDYTVPEDGLIIVALRSYTNSREEYLKINDVDCPFKSNAPNSEGTLNETRGYTLYVENVKAGDVVSISSKAAGTSSNCSINFAMFRFV